MIVKIPVTVSRASLFSILLYTISILWSSFFLARKNDDHKIEIVYSKIEKRLARETVTGILTIMKSHRPRFEDKSFGTAFDRKDCLVFTLSAGSLS